MNESTITYNPMRADSLQLDNLFWEVLWKPLGLPRNFRDSVRPEGREYEVVARKDGEVVGGLAATWTSRSEVEIRHIAVRPDAQNRGVGTRLVIALIAIVSGEGCTRVHTLARNTSTGFFEKRGFTIVPGTLTEHPVFTKHGIRLEMMERNCDSAGIPK